MKFLIVISLCYVSSYAFVCPPDYCKNVKCENAFCGPRDQLHEKGGICGCCDICVSQLEIGESCSTPFIGTPATKECYGNTFCHPDTGVCTYKCLNHRKQALKLAKTQLGVSVPKCNEDGSYAPFFCRGSRCICVRKDGTDTEYGMNAWETENATCLCALEKAEFMRSGLIGRMFYCTEKGEYDSVQCSGSVCFCADKLGKQLKGVDAVHIAEKSKLNC